MKMRNVGITLALAVALLAAGCGTLKYIPEDFDGQEYWGLATLSVYTDLSEACDPSELQIMKIQSDILMKYSEGTLKENIAEIYEGLHDEITQLADRDTPSPAYCKIKRQNISKLVDQAMDTFGDRRK